MDEDRTQPTGTAPPRGPNRAAVIGIGIVVALGVIGIGVLAGRNLIKDRVPPPTAPGSPRDSSPSPTPTTSVQEGFVDFYEPKTGITISYPGSWTRVPTRDPAVPLLATSRRGDSLQLRIVEIGIKVTRENLNDVKPITDKGVQSAESVELLAQPQALELGGLPGWFYFYSFKEGNDRGVHSHYFLFQGNQMIALVFQASPARRFPKVADTFDAIANSLRRGAPRSATPRTIPPTGGPRTTTATPPATPS